MRFKKFLSMLLAVLMVYSMLPMTAIAVDSTENVAKIGDTEYATLQAAIDAANAGDTVKLLRDITLTEKVLITDNSVLSNITLDGNGKTITVDGAITGIAFGSTSTSSWATGVKIHDLTVTGKGAYTGIGLVGGTSSTLTNVTVNGEFDYGINFYGTHGATLDNCQIVNAFTNGQSANPLKLTNNTVITTLIANDGTTMDPKITIDDTSFITTLYADDHTAMIDPDSMDRIGTILEVDSEKSMVASINGVLYSTLALAVANAADGDTITMISDTTEGQIIIGEKNNGKSITLDMNGKTFTSSIKSTDDLYPFAICIYSSEVTVKNGNVVTNDGVGGIESTYSGAVVTLENLTVDANGTNSQEWNSSAVSAAAKGKLIIKSGNYSSEQSAAAIIKSSGGEIVIDGGTFTTGCASDTSAAVRADNWENTKIAVLTINGGTFNAPDNGLAILNNAYTTAATTTVNGGTFNGEIDACYNNMAITGGTFNKTIIQAGEHQNKYSITGGTYIEDVSAYCAKGYAPVDNGDGTYGIVKAKHWYDAEATELTIDTAEELAELAQIVNGTHETIAQDSFSGKTVKLGADVDLSGIANWTPIGNNDNKFKGNFDGGDHTISNLVIDSTARNVGLFGYTTGGEIKNLTIHNAIVTADRAVGVVVGTPYTTDYTNIKVTGHVEVTADAYVGGVGGYQAYGDWTDITVDVDNTSFVKSTTTEVRAYVGGVIGFNGEGTQTYKNITSNIAVSGNTVDIGGITGIAHYGNNFVNVSCSGTVTSNSAIEVDLAEVGGIAGVWHNNAGYTVTFENASYTGTLAATAFPDATFENGGLVGAAYNQSNNVANTSGSLIVDGVALWPLVAMIGETGYTTLEAAIADIATDGSDTTIKILCDIEVAETINFPYGTGKVTFTADAPVTIKQTKTDCFEFVNDAAGTIVVGENVTFELYDNSSDFDVFYGANMELNGTIQGGQNWGALYLHKGEHTVSETGKIGTGRIHVLQSDLTVKGEVDTNYVLVEVGSFTADGAVIDAGVIYDNNNGTQRYGASEFAIKNSSTVKTNALNLSYADTVLTMDLSSKITAGKVTGAGKIVVDATGFNGTAVTVIASEDMADFTGTVELINNPGTATYEITEDGVVVKASVAGKLATKDAINYSLPIVSFDDVDQDLYRVVFMAAFDLEAYLSWYKAGHDGKFGFKITIGETTKYIVAGSTIGEMYAGAKIEGVLYNPDEASDTTDDGCRWMFAETVAFNPVNHGGKQITYQAYMVCGENTLYGSEYIADFTIPQN